MGGFGEWLVACWSGPLVRRELGVLAAAVWVAVWLTSVLLLKGLQPAHEEGGVLELTQASVLGVAVLLGAVGTVRLPPGSGRAWGFMLTLFALAAYAREADAHIVLNPRYLDEWGMRYRIDWWFDGQVSPAVKLGWLVVMLVPGVAGVWLVRASGVHPLEALRRRSPLAMAVLGCLALYALGYALDDLLGRGRFVPTWMSMAVEEASELGAACLVLTVCGVGLRAE